MATPGNPRSTGINPWLLVIGAAAVILVVVLFLLSGPVEAPMPAPDSPAATGTAGEPSGEAGEIPPGAPGEVPPNPDLAPGTGVDTTR